MGADPGLYPARSSWPSRCPLQRAFRRAVTQVVQGWSGVEVQLKRRHDLVPNLGQSRSARPDAGLDDVRAAPAARDPGIAARGGRRQAGDSPWRKPCSENRCTICWAYSEDNPEVHIYGESADFYRSKFEETEDQISAARRLYNGNVQNLNARIVTFPGKPCIGDPPAASRRRPFKIPAQESGGPPMTGPALGTFDT